VNNFKIEKNIPIPEDEKCGVAATARFMEIGDSLLLTNSNRSMVSKMSRDGRGKKFIGRRVDQLTFRMWRVA